MSDSETPQTAEPADHRTQLEEALVEVKRVIAGQDEMLERVLVCLVAGGHLLIEGVPGLAKTLTIKTTAAVLGGTFRRVQFTPDLVPSDLVGTRIYRPDTGGFDTEEGPVFCNFLLADEINRAPAKVQSALLEVMQERQVTIGHDTHLVPDPFLVMATQNPIESEGTYPLPEAQVDRFMLKVVVGYPTRDEELTVVQRSLVAGRVRAAGARARVAQGAAAGRAGRLRRSVARRLRRLARRGDAQPGDRSGSPSSPPTSSTAPARAARSRSSRAPARSPSIHGRDYVLGTDVRSLAKDALRHRLVLTYRALAEQRTADDVLDAVLAGGRDAAARARAAGRSVTPIAGIRCRRDAGAPRPRADAGAAAPRARALDRPARRRPARGRSSLARARPRQRARAGSALRAG